MLPGRAFYPEDAAPHISHQQSDDLQLYLQMCKKNYEYEYKCILFTNRVMEMLFGSSEKHTLREKKTRTQNQIYKSFIQY